MKPKVPFIALTGLLVLVALFLAGSAVPQAQAASSVVAFDMVGSASQNLISFTDDPAIPFTSAGDGFNKFQRGVSPSIPFAVADDSAGSYPPDNLGIIKNGNIDEFFGIVDTNNGDTGGRDVVATWVFDISGAENLNLSIDMGAMGDFEASNDFFNWSYSIDGGAAQTAFQSSVDEAATQDYTMEGGLVVTLNDPMLVNGTLLNNDLQTQTAALTGNGSQLTLILTTNTDGGSEAVAFQNIAISGTAGPSVVAFDMVGSASQNLISFTDDPAIPFTSAGDGFNKFQRGVSPSIPFAVADDSAGSYPPDNLGIIKTGNTDEFFGIVDTNNGDTGGRDVVATWVFDISGAENLNLSIDMGAMGDFEASNDFFNWSYSIDGGAAQTAFQSSVDEDAAQDYTMEGGLVVTLNDPMLVNGVLLNNDLQAQTAALSGSGSQLTLVLTANTDGGSEAVAFQNIFINGTAGPSVVAFDMVGSASQNLISFTDDPAIPFTSAGDGFNKFQRGVSPSIPFAVADDSAGSYPPDNLGIIKTGNTDEFFGIVDTNNGDTGGRDVVATWVFNVSGATELSLSINMGAMGDFEAANDFFNWSYSIDGGAAQTAFQSSVDEDAAQDYTMEGGLVVTLNDPMLVNGVLLNNNLQTQTAALSGSGSQLTLILTANTDGGSEAIAYQDIVISGLAGAGNTPPVVVSTDPGDGAEYVNVDSNIEITFNEDVTVTDPWFEINCGAGPIPATVSGGPASYTLDPTSDLPSTTACTVTVFAGQVVDLGEPPLNMEQDYGFSFTTNAVCGDPATFIHLVQGPGDASPIVGQIVTVEGVVVGDFQEGSELSGFFVQEENADFDGDVNTSEGVFVDEGSYAGPDVNEGDLVRASGTVVENLEHTEITAVNVLACDYAPGTFGPVDVTLPEETDGDLEKVEGMNVNVTNTMSVAQNYFLGRYGQLTLSSDLVNRLFQPTNQVLPNTQASADLADYNNRHLLFLDDGVDVTTCGDNPVPVPYLGPTPPSVLRGGDHVSNLTGVLDYGQINSAACSDSSTLTGRDYRLQPTQDPVFSTENPRTAAPADVGGTVKAVSFNVLNFFNGDGMGGGFPTSRGADSFNEFVRQRIKIYEAMKAIDGDIVGVMEIENDGFDEFSAIAELAKVMNEGPCWDSPAECAAIGYADGGLGAGTYAYIDAGPGVVGTDAITVGFIYKPASVTPVGDPLVVDEAAFVDPNNTGSDRNRPAIAQTFMENNGSGLFTPIVNHLKSKGSPCGPGDDDPEQASCNVTRTLAAQYLIDNVVPAVQAASGDLDVAIIGDLNAYAMEDPIRALTDGGFTNLVKAFNGDYAYSYTFDGMVGYLDHSLGNDSLTAQVTGVTEWHINTDEPAVIDYDEDYNPPGYYSPDAYRASDHDPVIVGLDVNGPPVCSAAVPDPEELWPVNHKLVPISILGVTDPDDDPISFTIDGIWQDEPVNGENDGNTWPDGEGVGTDTAWLRAERDGEGNGRAYHIYFTADDGQNNSCSGEVIVYAPLNKGEYGEAVDDGPLYDSTMMP